MPCSRTRSFVSLHRSKEESCSTSPDCSDRTTAIAATRAASSPRRRSRQRARRSDPAPAPAPAPEAPRAEAVKPKTEEIKGSRLTVGPDIKLKGAEITDCDTLVVEGRVEASMDARVIQISESGSFHGTVGVDVAEIRGRFEGEMTARKQLIIHPGGKVTGKIHYGKIVIEEGGELSGDVGTITGVKPATVLSAPQARDPGREPLVRSTARRAGEAPPPREVTPVRGQQDRVG